MGAMNNGLIRFLDEHAPELFVTSFGHRIEKSPSPPAVVCQQRHHRFKDFALQKNPLQPMEAAQ